MNNMNKKKSKFANANIPIVTADQVISNLKNLGVVFEESTKPFGKKDNNYPSAMGNYKKRLVIK